jgi:hypothetical protein
LHAAVHEIKAQCVFVECAVSLRQRCQSAGAEGREWDQVEVGVVRDGRLLADGLQVWFYGARLGVWGDAGVRVS